MSSFSTLFFGTDTRQRVRIARTLVAANVYVACIGLQAYACWIGQMATDDALALSGLILANVAFWYGLLRSGLNLRCHDPALTLPQIMAAHTIIVGAYATTGAAHGGVLMLLILVLVFGIFNLKPRAARLAGAYAVLAAGVATLYKTQSDPTGYPWQIEVMHLALVVASVPTVSLLAGQLSSLRARLQTQKNELAHALTRIQILATRDELTGLVNRRHMIEVINQHQKRLQRSGHHRFCLALLDIDHFKRINDTHGHNVGDEVLRHFALAAQQALRETDVLARWGGEEFLVLLNDTTPELAEAGIQRIREALAGTTVSPSVPELKLTFSAGLTGYADDEPLDQCVERADRALYQAKAAGRNRTVTHATVPHAPHAVTAGG